jgi:predicted nuclease of restriction endonuclease-like (RecB) superfamily
LVLLYWGIGKETLARQKAEGWGAKIIEQLADDLRRSFPEMKGLSPRNLKYMRALSEAWPEDEFVPQPVAQLPWGHNVRLLDLVKDREERLWYARAAIEHGWSRNVLVIQIEAGLSRRQGKANRSLFLRTKIHRRRSSQKFTTRIFPAHTKSGVLDSFRW